MSAGYRDESDAQLAGSDRTPVRADVPDELGTPTATIDLPGPIGSLHDVERDRCRLASLV
jgi:hypothetical protein